MRDGDLHRCDDGRRAVVRAVDVDLPRVRRAHEVGVVLAAAAERRRRGERREVRKKLREKVESLGFNLALANLTVIPGIVFAAGILFFIRRHNRK